LVAASGQSRHALKQAALARQSFRIVRKIATIRLEHRGHPGKSRLEGDIRRQRSITAMRTITLEEHFATPGFLDGPFAKRSGSSLRGANGLAFGRPDDKLCEEAIQSFAL
jgi:hypothetical protein